MKQKTKNNGLFNYTHVEADNYMCLVDMDSLQLLGTEVALGLDYYDRKTGKLLKNPKKAKPTDILEVFDYEKLKNEMPEKELLKQKFKKGEYVFKDDSVYEVLSNHYLSEDTEDNFNTFYRKVDGLDNAVPVD